MLWCFNLDGGWYILEGDGCGGHMVLTLFWVVVGLSWVVVGLWVVLGGVWIILGGGGFALNSGGRWWVVVCCGGWQWDKVYGGTFYDN